MRTLFSAALLSLCTLSFAQHSGNNAYEAPYSNYGYRADNRHPDPAPQVYLPNDSVYYLGASVMINLQPDAYLVVYSVQQEGATVAECSKLISTRISQFRAALAKAGIPENDVFVDMIAQTRIYDYAIESNTATQYKKGFEFKKNVIIRFKNNSQLEQINLLAAEQEIFDIVKVDYIISDIEKVQNQLREEAMKIIENKKKFVTANSSLEIKDKGIVQYEDFNTVYPNESYHKYIAAESATVQPHYYDSKAWVKEQRKSTTFYFERMHTAPFDRVVNPDMVSVPVQMTLTLGIKYYIGKPAVRSRK